MLGASRTCTHEVVDYHRLSGGTTSTQTPLPDVEYMYLYNVLGLHNSVVQHPCQRHSVASTQLYMYMGAACTCKHRAVCVCIISRAVKLCKIMYTICMQVWTLECVGRVGTIKIFNPPSQFPTI